VPQWNNLDEREAARWCREERPMWPLDRSLRIWLAFEAGMDWNPDDPTDQTQYDTLFDNVLAIWGKSWGS
jgi:hypothetical protein